jgi:hypothetical protein
MYDYREYFIAIAAIFLALALGILIGVSFGDNFLVSNQREIIELMEQELGRRKSQIAEKDEILNRWEQTKPLLFRGYRDSLSGKSIAVIAYDEHKASEVIALMEMTGAEVRLDLADDLFSLLSAEEPSSGEDPLSKPPHCYILLMEEEGPVSSDSVHQLWQLLHQQGQRIIAAVPWVESGVPVTEAEQNTLSIVDNIDTFWGQIALLEMAVHGAQGGYGFSPRRQGLIPLPVEYP